LQAKDSHSLALRCVIASCSNVFALLTIFEAHPPICDVLFYPLRLANARRLADVQAKRFAHHTGAYLFCWRVQLATCANERLRLKNKLR
jgi:hypothetical protein